MDEMSAVRDLRADTAPPDAERLAAGRARLMAEATGAATARRRRTWMPAVRAGAGSAPAGVRGNLGVGLAAAAVAGVLLATTVVLHNTGRPGVAASGAPSAAPSGTQAARLLEAAALAAAAAPRARTPGKNQWIYLSSVWCQQGACRTTDSWIRYGDGARTDFIVDPAKPVPPLKKVDVYPAMDEFGAEPLQARAYLAALPDNPAELLDRIRPKALLYPFPNMPGLNTTRAQTRTILDLLVTTEPTPTRSAAKLYRALATLPGLQVVNGRKDATGRATVAVGLPGGEYLLLDPVTYAYRGVLWDVKGDVPVLRSWALRADGIVDHPGQWPGGRAPSSVVTHPVTTEGPPMHEWDGMIVRRLDGSLMTTSPPRISQ